VANLPGQLDGVLRRFVKAEVRRGLAGNWYWLLLAGSTYFLRRVLNDRKIVVSNVTVSAGEQLVIAVRDRKTNGNNGNGENNNGKAENGARKSQRKAGKAGKAESTARKSQRKNGKSQGKVPKVKIVEIEAQQTDSKNGKAESKALTAIDA
jgi:hypothetical protein